MLYVPFEPWHLREVTLRDRDMALDIHTKDRPLADIMARFPSHTGFHNGTVVGCAGIIPTSLGTGMIWAVIGIEVRLGLFLAVHREVLSQLDKWHRDPMYKRIETLVRSDYPIGLRWAKMLGFRRTSGRFRGQDMEKHGHYLFAREA